MQTSDASKKQAAFRCVTLIVALFVVFVTVRSGIPQKLSSAILGDGFSRTAVDSDQLLDTVVSLDEVSTLYRFVNGTITVTEEHSPDASLPSDQQLASMTQTRLETLYERLLVESTANCSSNRRLRHEPATVPDVGRARIQQSICMVGRFEPRQPCYSFSFGISGTWELENELASSLGCQVLAFDPSMKQASHMRSERLLLLREGLNATATSGTVGSPPANNYLGYLTRFKAEKVTIDVLKMDIRPRDWPALETAVRDGSLRRVKQLVLKIAFDRDKVATARQLRSQVSILRGLHNLGFRRWFPPNITVGQLDGASMSYININYLLSISELARNPTGSRIALPLETLSISNGPQYKQLNISISNGPQYKQLNISISNGPQYKQLDVVKRANLSAMSAAELDVLYFNLVEQQHLYCPNSQRIGDADDGGWNVCFSEPFNISKSRPCVAFSFGINNIWRYDDQLADVHHCRVYMFDPSMTTVNDHQRRNTSWFYRTGLSSNNTLGANGWKMRTLCRLFDELGYSSGTIDILKIDIDYWEWVTFETALKDGCLRRVKQFLFETHTTGLFRKQSDYARFIRILMGIFNLGFRTWKWHKNPYSVFYKSDSGLTRACCYEHYLLNTNFIQPNV